MEHALSELAIVGQCNAAWVRSPFADGYFLVLVKKDGVLEVAPYYADGVRDFVETLAHIEKPFTLSPVTTQTWYTRVVYPVSLSGQPLLELVDASVIGPHIPVARGLGSGTLEAVLAPGPRAHLGLGSR